MNAQHTEIVRRIRAAGESIAQAQVGVLQSATVKPQSRDEFECLGEGIEAEHIGGIHAQLIDCLFERDVQRQAQVETACDGLVDFVQSLDVLQAADSLFVGND